LHATEEYRKALSGAGFSLRGLDFATRNLARAAEAYATKHLQEFNISGSRRNAACTHIRPNQTMR